MNYLPFGPAWLAVPLIVVGVLLLLRRMNRSILEATVVMAEDAAERAKEREAAEADRAEAREHAKRKRAVEAQMLDAKEREAIEAKRERDQEQAAEAELASLAATLQGTDGESTPRPPRRKRSEPASLW